MNNIEILDDFSNAVIAKVSSRNYPGILIQGDSFKIILDELQEIRDELEKKELSSAKTSLNILHEKLNDVLVHYQNVLNKNNIELPY